MINLPKISDLIVEWKRVIVRADLDVETTGFEKDLRIQRLIPTLDFLKDHKAEIVLIGHRGRPEGKIDENLSLRPFQPFFDKWDAIVEENLRFDRGEEENNPEFAKRLASLGDCYVNEAFANSHREHASIVGLPKLLPHAAGFRFAREVENLSKVLENPARPLVFIVGGSKKDKLDYIDDLKGLADKILVGGRLPEYLQGTGYSISDTKIVIANLSPDKEDITLNSIERFEEEIEKAGTIVLAGPMGRYEDDGHRQGTERIFKAVAESSAFKVAGGGDTEEAIMILDLSNGFDWVSLGGGAMLEYLVNGTLPGIEALSH